MFSDFQTSVFGKWILAGEHAVVRGKGALVFPIKEKHLQLTYTAKAPFSVTFDDSVSMILQTLFWAVLKKSLQNMDLSLESMAGHFHLEANLPVGVGMGASAAVCVALSRWCVFQKQADKAQIYFMAKSLEDRFHKKSSGVDIVGVSANQGVYFKQGKSQVLECTWHPYFQLSTCGEFGKTADCVEKVQNLWSINANLGGQLDEQMDESVNLAHRALQSIENNRLNQLTEAITLAKDCFYQWDLVTDRLHQHMQTLLSEGALAVKPTGSGGGGLVLSLWSSLPNEGALTL
jgi:mevalonate kinase